MAQSDHGRRRVIVGSSKPMRVRVMTYLGRPGLGPVIGRDCVDSLCFALLIGLSGHCASAPEFVECFGNVCFVQ